MQSYIDTVPKYSVLLASSLPCIFGFPDDRRLGDFTPGNLMAVRPCLIKIRFKRSGRVGQVLTQVNGTIVPFTSALELRETPSTLFRHGIVLMFCLGILWDITWHPNLTSDTPKSIPKSQSPCFGMRMVQSTFPGVKKHEGGFRMGSATWHLIFGVVQHSEDVCVRQ
jgi:hypothetical protein